MRYVRQLAGPAWLALGLAAGLVVGGLLPRAPLHAVATDRLDDFAIATGFVDEDVEAVYFLDVLTGVLEVGVISNTRPFPAGTGFQTRGKVNLNADLMKAVQLLNVAMPEAARGAPARPQLQVPTAPNYILVTGIGDIRRTGPARTKPSRALVYVAETNTGIVLAYMLNWDQNLHSADSPYLASLTLWAVDRFSSAQVRSP